MPEATRAAQTGSADGFDAFYAAHHTRVVVAMYAYPGDMAQAQDIAQEAFARALVRWNRLAGYDDPLAWVRRVAWNLATSRWRQLRRFDLFAAQQRVEHVPAPSADRIALSDALASLSIKLRRAIVMHYLADMSLAEIAEREGVPVGTVKSWLHRGRTALGPRWRIRGRGSLMPDVHEPELVRLFDDFAASVAATAPGPDLPAVRTRARRRRRTRWSAIAFASVVALAVSTVVYSLLGGTVPRSQPGVGSDTAGPASAIPSGSPTAAGQIEDTDWRYVTLAIPANETGCAAGTARFAADTDEMGHGVAEISGTRYRIGGGYNSEANPIVAYGDVDGDGAAEALLVISCLTPEGRRNPPSVVLLIGAEPDLRTLGLTFSSRPRQPDGEEEDFVTKLEVRPDGTVIIGVRTFEGMGQCEYRLRWTGATLTGTCEP